MTIDLRIAIVSDMHVGEGARAADLTPYTPTTPDQIETNYLDHFERFCSENSLEADYLLVPGDLSNKGHPMEVTKAAEVISRLARALNVTEQKTIFVPGNHDVDWYVLGDPGGDTTGLRQRQRYDALNHETNILSSSLGRATGSLVGPPYVATWVFEDLICIGFNSAWDDGPQPRNRIHHGYVNEHNVRDIEAAASQFKLDDRPKILLVHHHPYAHPEQNYIPDYSMIQNGERILEIARDNRIDFVLHGHKHRPFFKPLHQASRFPTNLFGAGSFSVLLGGGHRDESNQFHLVTIDKRDDSDQVLRGHIRSWAFRMGIGWDANKKGDGIRHVEPFGVHILPDNLKVELRALTARLLGSRDHFKWSDACSSEPDFTYIDLEAVKRAVEELRDEENIEAFWIENDTDLIVCRRQRN